MDVFTNKKENPSARKMPKKGEKQTRNKLVLPESFRMGSNGDGNVV